MIENSLNFQCHPDAQLLLPQRELLVFDVEALSFVVVAFLLLVSLISLLYVDWLLLTGDASGNYGVLLSQILTPAVVFSLTLSLLLVIVLFLLFVLVLL